MVEPEREGPGIRARSWTIPIKNAVLAEICPTLLNLGLEQTLLFSRTMKSTPYTIRAADTTYALKRWASIQSSSRSPRTAAGMQAMTILIHRDQVASLCLLLLLGLKGFSLWKYMTTTARMAPSWMTTRNTSLNASGWFSLMISSTSIICPVLLMGSHSVNPSTIPNTIIFNTSTKVINSPYRMFARNLRIMPLTWMPRLYAVHFM